MRVGILCVSGGFGGYFMRVLGGVLVGFLVGFNLWFMKGFNGAWWVLFGMGDQYLMGLMVGERNADAEIVVALGAILFWVLFGRGN